MVGGGFWVLGCWVAEGGRTIEEEEELGSGLLFEMHSQLAQGMVVQEEEDWMVLFGIGHSNAIAGGMGFCWQMAGIGWQCRWLAGLAMRGESDG